MNKDMQKEIKRLTRENSILRTELKFHLAEEFMDNYDMTEDEALRNADVEIAGILDDKT